MIELAKGFILNYTFQNCIELIESYVLYWIQWCWSEDEEEIVFKFIAFLFNQH